MTSNPIDKNKAGFFILGSLCIFFKHTDLYGYVHPYNFLEWTSYVREAFFQETVANFTEVLRRPVKMMTVRISSSLLQDSEFGDQIEARLSVDKIKKVSFDMIVRFYNVSKGTLVCMTRHTVVFVDTEAEGFAPIPSEMADVIIHYRESTAS